MILAIKRVHNVPPHLSCLHYLTLHKNRNAALTSWSRGSLGVSHVMRYINARYLLTLFTYSLTLGAIFLMASSMKPLTSGKQGCVHVFRQRNVTSTPTVIIQPHNRFFSEPLTLMRGSQH